MSDLTGDSSLKRLKCGRPVGSTMDNKRKKRENVIDAKNEITMRYRILSDEERKKSQYVRKGHLKDIAEEVKKKRKNDHTDIIMNTTR